MGDQPVAALHADVRQHRNEVVVQARGVVVQHADAGPGAHGLDLADHPRAFEPARLGHAEIGEVVERGREQQVADIGDDAVAGEIGERREWLMGGRIVPRRIEAQPIIGELAHAEASLLRRLDGDRHVGLALGEREARGGGARAGW